MDKRFNRHIGTYVSLSLNDFLTNQRDIYICNETLQKIFGVLTVL